MDADEQALVGGNATAGVVLVDGTVRKPWNDSTPAAHRFMDAMRSAGIVVPRSYGRDEQGRQILEYVEGSLAMDLPSLSDDELKRVGGMVRSIHDAAQDIPVDADKFGPMLLPAVNPDLICHNDLAPWNLVVGERWAFIDWDGAGPSTRLWDLAYSAQTFANLNPGQDPEKAGHRLRTFVIDGYRASGRLLSELPTTMPRRTQSMYDLLARSAENDVQPWGRMFHEGHGDHWRAATEYLLTHQHLWRCALSDVSRA